MRRNVLIIGIVLLASAAGFGAVSPALAGANPGGGTWELGVVLGEPTGLSAKYWMSNVNAVDFGAAWSFENDGNFHIHCDYLFHNYEIFQVDQGSLPLYFGVGGRARFDEDDARVGLRLVLGLEYLVEAYPMSVFFEVAPIVDFAPETEADLNGGFGIRYVF